METATALERLRKKQLSTIRIMKKGLRVVLNTTRDELRSRLASSALTPNEVPQAEEAIRKIDEALKGLC